MSALLQHLQSLNAKTKLWVEEDPTNRFAGLLTEDVSYWASMGITTVEQFEHYMLVNDVFEATRSAFDYKPSWGHLNSLSDEDLKKELDSIENYIQSRHQREIADEAAHKAAVESAMNHRSGFSIGELFGGLA